MGKKALSIGILLFLATGYVSLTATEAREEKNTMGNPVITQSFASKEVRTGDTWKVYLNASDPEGKMKNFYVIVDQPGVGQYPLNIIRIKEANQKELSGYLYLHTSSSISSLNLLTLTLKVWIQDRSGQFSEPVVFPLSIRDRYTQKAPPQGVFKDQSLGPVMVTVEKPTGGGVNDYNDK